MASARRPCSASRTTSSPARAEPRDGEGPIEYGYAYVPTSLARLHAARQRQCVTYASGNNTGPPTRLDVARAWIPSDACAVNNLVVQWKHMPLTRHRARWVSTFMERAHRTLR